MGRARQRERERERERERRGVSGRRKRGRQKSGE
jgi:hypothetical protein